MSIIKGTNQIVAGFGGTKRSIGEVYFSQSALATDNSGALPLFTGETIASANTIYPEFYNWVSAHTELQCTSAEYEAALTTYGECAKYVIGDGSLRLPLIKNYIKAANPSEGIKNVKAGLPNITAKMMGTTYGALADAYVNASGACRTEGSGGAAAKGGQELFLWKHDFDASLSNPIYGKSSTVTPASTTLYPWVVAYAAAIPASTAQAAEFQQGLSGKADTNLGNLSAAGKDLASGLGMPSNRYIDLELGANSTGYTAPANGWFALFVKSNSTTGWYGFSTPKLTVRRGPTSNRECTFFAPVRKGETCSLWYSGLTLEKTSASYLYFRFFYAEGAE